MRVSKPARDSRYRDGERHERGEVILNEAAQELGVSTMTVLRMIRDKTLPARQTCPGAPWVIARADLEARNVRAAIGRGRGPLTVDPRQKTMNFQ